MAILQVQGRQIACDGILFDKDGTLLEFLQLWGPWAESLLNQLERKLEQMGGTFTLPKEQVFGTVHDPHGRIVGYDPQGPLAIATVDESTGLLAGQLYAAGMAWNDAVTAIRSMSTEAMCHVRQKRHAESLHGLPSFVRSCMEAALPLAVVTSDSTAAAEEHLEWMGLRPYFASIVGCDRVTLGKPDGESALLACRELNIRPESAVVVGDSNGDMQMGRSIGAALLIGVSPSGSEAARLRDADIMIRDYAELSIIQDA